PRFWQLPHHRPQLPDPRFRGVPVGTRREPHARTRQGSGSARASRRRRAAARDPRFAEGRSMKKKKDAPAFLPVDERDLDPGHRWHRPLQAPGITQVDFEERVDFRRLHRYRLARTRQALAGSGLGAMLCFDQHNIRYISSTVIGEWARDKLIRYCLLTG